MKKSILSLLFFCIMAISLCPAYAIEFDGETYDCLSSYLKADTEGAACLSYGYPADYEYGSGYIVYQWMSDADGNKIADGWVSTCGTLYKYIGRYHYSCTLVPSDPAECSNGVPDINEFGLDCGGECQEDCLFSTVPVETDLPQNVGDDFRLSSTINLGSVIPTADYPVTISILDSDGASVVPAQTCTSIPCEVSAILTDQPQGENTYTIVIEKINPDGSTTTSSDTVTTTVRDQTLADLLENQSDILLGIGNQNAGSPELIKIGSRRIPIAVFKIKY